MVKMTHKYKLIVFILLLIPSGFPRVSGSPTYNYSFNLDSNEYRAFPLTTNSSFKYLMIDFTCQNCEVSLYILNKTNFELFYSGGEFQSLISKENIDKVNLSVELEPDSLYYILIYNKGFISIEGIYLIFDISEISPSNQINILIISVIIFGNIFALFLVVYQYRAKKTVVNLSDKKLPIE